MPRCKMAEPMTLTELVAHPTIKETVKRFAIKLLCAHGQSSTGYDPKLGTSFISDI